MRRSGVRAPRSSILGPSPFAMKIRGLSRSPSAKTGGPWRHNQFARTNKSAQTLPLWNRRPFSVAHAHKQMRDGPLAQPVDALHTHDVISRLLENMRGGGESVLRKRHYITIRLRPGSGRSEERRVGKECRS